jgi:hypothetical protein
MRLPPHSPEVLSIQYGVFRRFPIRSTLPWLPGLRADHNHRFLIAINQLALATWHRFDPMPVQVRVTPLAMA